jgi:hypothetical protein
VAKSSDYWFFWYWWVDSLNQKGLLQNLATAATTSPLHYTWSRTLTASGTYWAGLQAQVNATPPPGKPYPIVSSNHVAFTLTCPTTNVFGQTLKPGSLTFP